MLKKITFVSIIIILSVASSFLHSQSTQSTKWTFSLYGGYTQPEMDLKGDLSPLTMNYGERSYLLKFGYNIGGEGKYYLNKYFTLNTSISYNNFKSSAPNSELTNYSISKRQISITSASLGLQYNFLRYKFLNSFLRADLTNNFYSGEFQVKYNEQNLTYNLNPTYRLGLQFGGGFDVGINKSLSLLLGINYNVANLIGKSSSAIDQYNLADGWHLEGTDYNTSSRMISYLQFYSGISFNLNKELSEVQKKKFYQSSRWSYAVIGGYSLAAEDLKEDNNGQYLNSYNQLNGFNIGTHINYSLTDSRNLDLLISADLNSFSRHNNTMSFVSASLGMQYNFIPNKMYDPFVSLQVSNNFITRAGFSPDNIVYRTGFTLGAGVNIAIKNNWGILAGADYNSSNILWKGPYLGDAAFSNAVGENHETKGITYFQFFVGISFYPSRIVKNI